MLNYQSNIQQTGAYDVIVCGAGPSGIAAAVTVARAGFSVALLERFGSVGGNITQAKVTTIMGSVSSGTIAQEITQLLMSPDGGTAVDPEHARFVLTDLVNIPNLHLFLQCAVVDVATEEQGEQRVIAATQEGLTYFAGKCIVDATGDGIAAAKAGATVMKGRPGDKLLQPASLMYHIDGVAPGTTLVCRHEEDETILPNGKGYLALTEWAAKEGILPAQVTIVRLYPTHTPGEYLVNATQSNGIDGTHPADVAKAEIDLRQQIRQVNDFLRKYVPGFENIRVRTSGSTVGIRETRRIEGQYILHDDDLVAGRRFEDVVVHNANFVIDIHNPTGGGQAETDGCPHTVQSYDIPLRSLRPKGVEQLILAGRCISGTHRAHASYRVMNIAMAIGQAAGALAIASLQTDTPVSAVDHREVQKLLEQMGCDLFS